MTQTRWQDVAAAIAVHPDGHAGVRSVQMRAMHRHTGRNVLHYSSGFLQRRRVPAEDRDRLSVGDYDKTALIALLPELDPAAGLDLLLHTPGGDIAATESMVYYLRTVFGTDIRAIVPQIAMSAGTILALSGNTVVMGPYSSVGPFDPHVAGGTAADSIAGEFHRAAREIAESPAAQALWQPILAQYGVGLLSQAENALAMAEAVVRKTVLSGLFHGRDDAEDLADALVAALGRTEATRLHARHVERADLQNLGVPVANLEDDPVLEDLVLRLHFAAMATFDQTNLLKIVETHDGAAVVSSY